MPRPAACIVMPCSGAPSERELSLCRTIAVPVKSSTERQRDALISDLPRLLAESLASSQAVVAADSGYLVNAGAVP